MDVGGRSPVPHRPFGWTWLSGPPSPSLNPCSSAPTAALAPDHRLIDKEPLLIGFGLRSRQPLSQSTDHNGDIITECFLKHSVTAHDLVRRARACDRWGGKGTWPVLKKENRLSRAWTMGGGSGLLAAPLSMLGCNLKEDQTAAPQSNRALTLPHHLPLSSLSTCTLPPFSKESSFHSQIWTKRPHRCSELTH